MAGRADQSESSGEVWLEQKFAEGRRQGHRHGFARYEWREFGMDHQGYLEWRGTEVGSRGLAGYAEPFHEIDRRSPGRRGLDSRRYVRAEDGCQGPRCYAGLIGSLDPQERARRPLRWLCVYGSRATHDGLGAGEI